MSRRNPFTHFTRDRSCTHCGDVVPFKNVTWCGDKPYCSGKCLSEAEAVEFDTEWVETVVLDGSDAWYDRCNDAADTVAAYGTMETPPCMVCGKPSMADSVACSDVCVTELFETSEVVA